MASGGTHGRARSREASVLARCMLFLCLSVLNGAYAGAQERPGPSRDADSLKREGELAGRIAADKATVSGFFVSGFIGGAALGTGATLLGVDREQTAASLLLVGSGSVVTGFTIRAVRKAACCARSTELHDESYTTAFNRAFSERLRQRGFVAVAGGVLTGAALGSALLYFFLSQVYGG